MTELELVRAGYEVGIVNWSVIRLVSLQRLTEITIMANAVTKILAEIARHGYAELLTKGDGPSYGVFVIQGIDPDNIVEIRW